VLALGICAIIVNLAASKVVGGFLQLIIIFYKRNKPKEFTWLIMHVQRACLNES